MTDGIRETIHQDRYGDQLVAQYAPGMQPSVSVVDNSGMGQGVQVPRRALQALRDVLAGKHDAARARAFRDAAAMLRNVAKSYDGDAAQAVAKCVELLESETNRLES